MLRTQGANKLPEQACDGDVIRMQPIGTVERSSRETVRASDIDGLRAESVRLVVRAEYAEALLGLVPGSDILVLTYLARASRDTLQVHPRGDLSRPLRGVFATRSPSRPNPIGMTSARILAIHGTALTVIGLDAWDGTPVLDIKPWSEAFDTPYSSVPES